MSSSWGGPPTGGSKAPRGYNQGSQAQFTPEQMQLFQQMFGQVSPNSFLSKLAGGDESQFEQLEAPAWKAFGQGQNSIANRFSGMGMGARRSSGFNQNQNSFAQDFAQKLQANRMGIQNQAIKDLHGMSQDLLNQRPYENYLMPKQKPWWQDFASSIMGGIGTGVGNLPTMFNGYFNKNNQNSSPNRG